MENELYRHDDKHYSRMFIDNPTAKDENKTLRRVSAFGMNGGRQSNAEFWRGDHLKWFRVKTDTEVAR